MSFFCCSDCSKKALLPANTYYKFYFLDQEAKKKSPKELESLQLRDYYMFRMSTTNIKIENTKMKMIYSQRNLD